MKHSAIALLSVVLTTVSITSDALAQSQGVSNNEIVIGTIQDLSGPVAAYGKQARQGMQLRIDELNEQGGVNGRRIKLVVEDSAYDPKKAVLATQKLVNKDSIFAMVAHFGTAHNMAAMPIQFERNVINFMPISAAREMYEPAHKLKFAYFATYYDQIRTWLPKLVKDKGARKICTIYQDDDAGLEVVRGAEAALKAIGMDFTERTSFKRGATDFSSQVARMKAAGCDLVVLGTIIRETIGTIAEARKTGFAPVFVASQAAYTDVIPRLGGKSMDGLYATMVQPFPNLDDGSQAIRFWANKYKTRFGDDPTVFSCYGYEVMDAFVIAARKAGANLTVETFVKAMNGMTIPPDIFGAPEMKFSATRRLGSTASRLSQLQDGRWKVITEYMEP